jgi:hypothetical protein
MELASIADRKTSFINFIDAIFTNSFEQAFTKPLDQRDANAASACVCRRSIID